MLKQNRAQASLEILFVALIILFLSTFLLSSWFSISDETLSLILFRLETNSLFNKAQSPYRIVNAYVNSENSTLKITSQIEPNIITKDPSLAENFSNIACKIIKNTSYERIELEINNTLYSC